MIKKIANNPSALAPILMNLNVAVFRTTNDGRGGIVDVNPAFLEIFDYPDLQALRKIQAVDLYANPADRELMRQELEREGAIQSWELLLKRSNGDVFPAQVSSVLVKDAEGQAVYIDGVVNDISELKNTVDKLEQKKRELEDEQKIFFRGPVIMIQWPLHGAEPLKYISANVKEILGYDAADFMSGEILYPTLIHSEDQSGLEKQIQEILDSGEDTMFIQPYRLQKRNGDYIWVQDYAYIRRDQAGIPTDIVGYIYDVTETQEYQRQTADSELRYRGLVENSPTGILRMDLDGNILDVNPQMLKILGSPSVAATRSFNMFTFPPLKEAGISQRFREVIESRATVKFSGIYNTAWGKHVYYQAVINPVFDAEGQIIGAQANMEDETVTHEAREAKREIERLQLEERNIFVSAPIMIFRWNVSAKEPLEYVTENVEKILGYTVAELLAGDVLYGDIIHPGERERALSQAREMILKGVSDFNTAPYRIRRKDGEYIWVNDHSMIVRGEDGQVKHITGILYDITKSIEAENTLKAIETTYREVFNATGESIFIHDTETFKIIDVNQTMLKTYECTYAQALSLTAEDLSCDDNPAEEIIKYFTRAAQGEPQNFESHAVTFTGKPFWADVNLRRATLHGEPRILATTRDISARREMETELREALKEQEVLTREVHHRVKNNMQVITSMLNLQAEYTQDPILTEVFKETQNRIRSMALIHEKLFRSKSMAEVEFDNYLKSLIREVSNFYADRAAHIKFHEEIDPVLMDISKAIPSGLIVNELITNTLKYAFPNDREGSVWIRLSTTDVGNIQIQIQDDGIGLPEHVDFATTPTMGLRIVRILTEQLGGEMAIRRVQGTTFSLTFAPEIQD